MSDWPQRLLEERHRAGLTQAQLAARLRVAEDTIRRWERGLGTPQSRMHPRLAEALPDLEEPPRTPRETRPPALAAHVFSALEAGLTRREVAKRVGVTPQAVSYVIRRAATDGMEPPSAMTANKIAEERRAFGARLQDALEARGWGHRELAAWVGVTETAVRLWIDGTATPRPEVAREIVEVLPAAGPVPPPRRVPTPTRPARRRRKGR